MKTIGIVAALLVALGSARAEGQITLQGTGATFPAPLYQRWFTDYNKLHPEGQINYQPLGSGAGVKQFTEGLVNFGASDAAMTDEEIAAVKDGVVLLPMTAGSIVLGYNLPGAPKELKLSRILNAPPVPYTRERFDHTYQWTLGWGLVQAGATYENTVDNRAWQ